jgi:hypothetical protein
MPAILGETGAACNSCRRALDMFGWRDRRRAEALIRGMRYSKWALLTFGAGLVLGLAVVAAKLPSLARVASLTIAAGIIALPFAAAADWRRHILGASRTSRRREKAKPGRRRAAPGRRRAARRR